MRDEPGNRVSQVTDYRGAMGAIMSRGVIALYTTEPALKAIALMVEHRIRTIPIVADTVAGTVVVGVVTRRDLTAALTE